MARILLCAELGGNLGHVARLRALARALREQGHAPLFAINDLRGAEEYLEPELGPAWQAPQRQGAPRNPVKTQISYASLLNNSGYDDVLGLASRLRAWRELLQQLRIDLVVADHAPSAALAAQTLGLPCALIGTGFTVPPLRAPFPLFQPDLKVADELLARNEAAVLQNLNRALERLQLKPLARLRDLFAKAEPYVLSYAELDHYECGREEPYRGIVETSQGAPPRWPAGEGPRILAYLRPAANLDAVLAGLARCGARVLLRAGGIPLERLRQHAGPRFAITDQAIDMRQATQDCDAYVSYASHGLTAEMLLAGKPGLLLPDNVERALVARRAGQLGAALSPPLQGQFNLSEALRRLLEDPALRSAAEAFAARYRSEDRAQNLRTIAGEIAALRS